MCMNHAPEWMAGVCDIIFLIVATGLSDSRFCSQGGRVERFNYE